MWFRHQLDLIFHLGARTEYPIMAKAKVPRKTTTQTTDSKNTLTGASHPTLQATPQTKSLTDLPNNVTAINLEDEIRRRAYELWEQCGRESGHENEHWLSAEREIRSRHSEPTYSA